MHLLDMKIELGFYEERFMNMCLKNVLQDSHRICADVNTKTSPHGPSKHAEQLFPHTKSALTAHPVAGLREWHGRW